MDTLQILRLAIDQASEINTYWNFYIAVATAVLGIMASGKSFTNSNGLKIILTLAFIVFAVSNANAIIRIGELRSALIGMLPSELPEFKNLVTSLKPAPWYGYLSFHIVLDLSVIACIWIVRWPESKN